MASVAQWAAEMIKTSEHANAQHLRRRELTEARNLLLLEQKKNGLKLLPISPSTETQTEKRELKLVPISQLKEHHLLSQKVAQTCTFVNRTDSMTIVIYANANH